MVWIDFSYNTIPEFSPASKAANNIWVLRVKSKLVQPADSSNHSLQLATSPSDLNTPLSVPFMNDACIEKNKY
jgi:hypothetical protein